jgi:gamma-glutamyltranspeptidase/glutathione hydrolase
MVLKSQIDSVVYKGWEIIGMDRPTKGRLVCWLLRVLENLPPYKDKTDDMQAMIEVVGASVPTTGKGDEADRQFLLTGDSAKATASKIDDDVKNKVGRLKLADTGFESNTTALVTCDSEGNVVSLTQSLGPAFGAGIMLPKWGLTFAASMNYLEDKNMDLPPNSAIAPTIAVNKEAHSLIATGGAGSSRIPGTIVQVLHQLIDRHLDLQTATAYPRMACEKRNGSDHVRLEKADQPSMKDMTEELKHRGLPIEVLPEASVPTRINSLYVHDDQLETTTDGRWFGQAAQALK